METAIENKGLPAGDEKRMDDCTNGKNLCKLHDGLVKEGQYMRENIRRIEGEHSSILKTIHEGHGELWKEIRSKPSLTIFTWAVGLILLAMMAISGYQWAAIDKLDTEQAASVRRVEDRIDSMQTAVIKALTERSKN